MKVKSLSCVWLLVTPWIAAYQAPPPMGFSRQEYWSGVPLPSPFHVLAIVNNATVNIYSSVFSFREIPEFLGHVVVLLLIFEEPLYCFPCWLHQFTFHTVHNEHRSAAFPHPHHGWLFLVLLIIVILTSMKQYLSVVLIRTCLLISDVEYLFLYLLGTFMSSYRKNVYLDPLPFFIFGFILYWFV